MEVLCFGMQGCSACDYLEEIIQWLKKDNINATKYDVYSKKAKELDIKSVPFIKIYYKEQYHDIEWIGRTRTYKNIKSWCELNG